MPPAVKTLSEQATAEAFGVDRTAVRQWREQGCPHRKVGGRYEYRLSEVAEWRIDRAKRTTRDETAPDEATERARKLRAEADLKELELQQARGEVVPVAEWRAELEGAFERVRAKLLAIPGEHATRFGELGAREATLRLRDMVDAVLTDLEAASDVPDDEPLPEAA